MARVPTNPDISIRLSQKQHDDLAHYVTAVYMFLGGNIINLRQGLEMRDRAYYRETDTTIEQFKARLAVMRGDAKKFQNMTVPVVSPQVETGVGYLAEVFCTGEPFFGVVTPPSDAGEALQFESVISDHSRRFGWRAEFIKSFRDLLKYNISGMEMSWEKKKTFTIINDPFFKNPSGTDNAEELYAGNRAKRIDLYNAIIDTRVAPNKVHETGEFAGYVELMPRTQLKQLIIDLGSDNSMNVTNAFQSNAGNYTLGNNTSGQYYIPLINPLALIAANQTGMNWAAWMSGITNNGTIEYKDLYEVATIYARFLPSDFGLDISAKNTPQIFKLLVVNKRWIIHFRRMGNAHNYLPIVFGQAFDDGLMYQSKSFSDNVTPYQEMASALYNSAIASKRRLVYDRLFYDPSRINKSDIDNVSEVARIPVKQAAYGKPVSDAVYSANYRDDNSVGVIDMASKVQQMAQFANGLNNPAMGQFQKGNKTRSEFDTTMERSNWTPRLYAITLEDNFMTPIKEIVKMNILQFQGQTTLYNIPKKQEVQVKPVDLRRKSFQFKLSDGQTPSEKLNNSELMGQIAQFGMAVPAINAQYDIIGMLTYGWKQQGAWWLDDFRRDATGQAAYLQAAAATATAEAPPNQRLPDVANEQTPPQGQ